MPPDEQEVTELRNRPSPVQQTVNVGADTGIFAGLGKYKSIVAFGFAGIVGILFVYAFQLIVSQGWEQRAEDRQMFREAIRDMNAEQNRRTGEVKGSTDKLIDVVRENNSLIQKWIEESRRARAEHVPAPKTDLKPTMPP